MSVQEDPFSGRLSYLGTGIGNLAAAKSYLRRKWNKGQPEAIQVRPGHRFYVTLRAGRRSALLLGPYVSHMTAIAVVPRARRLLGDRARFGRHRHAGIRRYR